MSKLSDVEATRLVAYILEGRVRPVSQDSGMSTYYKWELWVISTRSRIKRENPPFCYSFAKTDKEALTYATNIEAMEAGRTPELSGTMTIDDCI